MTKDQGGTSCSPGCITNRLQLRHPDAMRGITQHDETDEASLRVQPTHLATIINPSVLTILSTWWCTYFDCTTYGVLRSESMVIRRHIFASSSPTADISMPSSPRTYLTGEIRLPVSPLLCLFVIQSREKRHGARGSFCVRLANSLVEPGRSCRPSNTSASRPTLTNCPYRSMPQQGFPYVFHLPAWAGPRHLHDGTFQS